ncbi:hypothetical protein [Staphylococcus xylosus]
MNNKVQKIGANGGSYIPSMRAEVSEDINEKVKAENKRKQELSNQKRKQDLHKAYKDINQQVQ